MSFKTLSFVAFLAASLQLANAQVPSYRGELMVQPRRSNAKCMTANSNSDGAQVTMQACTGADSQKWVFNDGSMKVFGNKCLDVVDGANVDGTKLQIWTCSDNKNPNQQWYYTGDRHIAWTDHGRCIDLTDGSLTDGNRPQLWSCDGGNTNQVWNVGYSANNLPQTTQEGQTGVNNCGTGNSQDSQCQTAWLNSADDFCLWAPPAVDTIGNTERIEVAWCTKSGRGTRLIPDGTLQGVHFVKTPEYVQITGVGDFTKINIPQGDEGGELDPHGADGNGNPVGGLVFGNTFGNAMQYHEWTSFISYNQFCFRACVGADSATRCQHIYDVMGCNWNIPGNYNAGAFENCDGDMTEPMGVYGTSTWFQGVQPTPAGHPPAASSNCASLPTVSVSPAKKRRDVGFEKVKRAPTPSF